MADALRRGYKVAIPFGEDWDYDLIVLRNGKLERVQCKYTESGGETIRVKCHSTNNWCTKSYSENDIDWLAVYDKTTDKCYYIPSKELGKGRYEIKIRLTKTKNNQKKYIRMAQDYLDW